MMPDDALTRHFFIGFIRLHILYHAARDPVYGAELTEELNRHGYPVSQGTLYPTLHTLERLGFLQCEEKVIDGRRRKYYSATRAGLKVLTAARRKLQELVSEVLEDEDHPFQTIRQKHGSHSRPKTRSKPARRSPTRRAPR